jgi:hypothetical protein
MDGRIKADHLNQMDRAAVGLGKDRLASQAPQVSFPQRTFASRIAVHSVPNFPRARQPLSAGRENLQCGRDPCFHGTISFKFVCHKGTSGTRWNALVSSHNYHSCSNF